ncbi:WD40 repeat-like protein [Rhizopogon vinicolor AM-OR11-026]|uniref:WD40 repeat-like protein n=1 Tax=Rhizopogon vinicolor AM-OR11-026 TaxID=1314800 RepID=A0A1B7N3P1_9AGAM|nr:WD40 repeat-like protein [Rhizopogon vinicolor AM-OR11-026]
MQDMALSRDGQLIASSDESGYVTAWHGDTYRPVTQAFRAHSTACPLDFSPDGTTLVTGSFEGCKLWNTKTWQLQGESFGSSFAYGIHCIRYSPSGELLAIAANNAIEIWNIFTRTRIADFGQGVPSAWFVWTPDNTCLLSGDRDGIAIREWNSSTWNQAGDMCKGPTGHPWRLAVNRNGTVIASPTTDNHVRLWRLSDRQTIAIFQHSDSPCCVTFSMDGKHILVGCKDKKILEWAVPKHAWPEDARGDEVTHQTQNYAGAQNSDTKAQDSNTEAQGSDTKACFHLESYIACMSGDLATAEELLTREIDANGNNYPSYANRSVVMARKLEWDRALDDATKSLSIQPSLMGYIALCGRKQVRVAREAFDLAFTFTDGDLKTIHAIALFHGNQHAEAMRRVRELAAACPDADTSLACRTMEVYLHIQLGNKALDSTCPTEASDHFTAAVNSGTFLSKLAVDSKYEEFVVLFGCDFTSLWQTANQKRCHALLRAGKLAAVFEAYQYMVDMSDETTRVSCLKWSIGFMKELTTFQDYALNLNADSTPDMCKYDDGNDSISDIDSDIDHVGDVVS